MKFFTKVLFAFVSGIIVSNLDSVLFDRAQSDIIATIMSLGESFETDQFLPPVFVVFYVALEIFFAKFNLNVFLYLSLLVNIVRNG